MFTDFTVWNHKKRIYGLFSSGLEPIVFLMKITQKQRLILFLLIIPGLLQEVLTGNTPILNLLNPVGFLGLIWAYGVPMLILWDLKVQYKLSYYSIFLLWIAYWIFNEWLLAKTMLESSTVPFGGFREYISYAWINLAWTSMILPWHALYTVLFPMTLAEIIFKEERFTTILSIRWRYVWLFICGVIFVFLWKDWQGSLSISMCILFYTGIIILYWLSRMLPQKSLIDTPEWPLGGLKLPYFMGVISLFAFVPLFIFAGKVHGIVFILFIILWVSLTLFYFSQISMIQKGRFSLGVYLSFWGFGTLASLAAWRIDLIIAYVVILAILHYSILRKTH